MALSRYGKADKIYDDGTGLLSAIVRRFKVDGQYTTVAQLPTAVFLAYETADEEHDDCLLAHQDVKSREGVDPQESILTRVYVQIPADAATLVQIGNDLVTYSENGLKMVEQRFFGKRTHSLTGTVGTTAGASGDTNTLILTSNGFAERGKVSAVVVKRWAEAGILQAYKGFQKDGLLLVTFESQGTAATPTALNAAKSLTDPEHEAFSGGAAAPLFRSRIINVNGFRRYIRSVLLLKDGDPLATGSTLTNKEVWHDVEYPGSVSLSFDKGIEPYSGSVIPVEATLEVKLTTSSDVGAAPYSIKSGAYAQINYVPTETNIPTSISKAFGPRYLAGGGLSGNNTTFLGGAVTAIAGSVSSSPTYSVWLARSAQRLEYQHDEAFVTDEGTQWYRETTLTLIGAFADYD